MLGFAFPQELTNCTAFLSMIYAAISAGPVLCPILAEVRWDGLFHPRGPVRRTLFAISLTTTVYLSVVFWTALGMVHDNMPRYAVVWDIVTNIGAHGSNAVWLLLDACVFDRNMARSYTKSMCLPPILFGLWYFAKASAELVMTELAPYFFLEPGYPYKYVFVGVTLLLGVSAHFAVYGVFHLYAKVVPYPSSSSVADGDRVYGMGVGCASCQVQEVSAERKRVEGVKEE
ncbi:hypothetical protein KIPB_009065 [Kipferlia bialata]|uniref:Uncharacterized protein n=1 Tax=Kipferlia bialata TaxID=797122 RepID=A0A9K3D2M3_9EUKA|nr:hypothetical protein KIPB_009065 [Kipferlia bialata]|eukprot:g9065.t1